MHSSNEVKLYMILNFTKEKKKRSNIITKQHHPQKKTKQTTKKKQTQNPIQCFSLGLNYLNNLCSTL